MRCLQRRGRADGGRGGEGAGRAAGDSWRQAAHAPATAPPCRSRRRSSWHKQRERGLTLHQAMSKTALRWASHCARGLLGPQSSAISVGSSAAVSTTDTYPSSSATASSLLWLYTWSRPRARAGARRARVRETV